jgi:hypothetical protein
VNNKDTLQLSPVLTESYIEIAEEALNRAIVDLRKSRPYRTSASTSVRMSTPRRSRKSSFWERAAPCSTTKTCW